MTESKSAWHEFLESQGAVFAPASASAGQPEDAGTLTFPGDAFSVSKPAGSFLSPLTDLGLISASGEEAASFLHNQLSNDVEHLDASEARLAAYCSPKGRMLASFLIWKATHGQAHVDGGELILLQLPLPILPAIQKRLQMFVLRSKVKLADASARHVMLGLSGPDVSRALEGRYETLPAAFYGKIDNNFGSLIRLPDAGAAPRYLWITDPETACASWPDLTTVLKPAGTARWRLGDIESAIPTITAATQDKFVPQMINFEAIGGVNFRKGCYPGQEIVARTQYLGKLKRRMLRASVPEGRARAGMEVFSSADPAQPCGMIVNAEALGDGGSECLVEIKVAALENSSVHLGSATGPALRFHSLPYALNESI